MKPADAVQAWIEEHFDLTKIIVTDFPLFPWGKLLDDGTDTMIVFYDILYGRVEYRFPWEKGDDERQC